MPDETPNEPTDQPDVDENSDDDSDVEGHVFASRTRPHEQGGSGPGISGALDPDVDVRS